MGKFKSFILIVAFLLGATIVLKYTKYPKTLLLVNRVITIIFITWIIARTQN